MKIEELAAALNLFYETGKKSKECKTFVHLFGIKYADVISKNNIPYKEIVEKSSLPEAYANEVYSGMKLAKYVTLKDETTFIQDHEND